MTVWMEKSLQIAAFSVMLVAGVDVEVASEVVDGGAKNVNHHLHVSDFGLNHLAGSNRLAESDTVVGALDGNLKHALSHAEVGHGNVNARDGQRVDGDLHALAFFAEQVLGRENEVGEFQACMASALAAHHMRHRDDLEAGSVVGDEKCGETFVAGLLRIGNCDDVGEVRAVGVRNEPLLAVEDIVAVFVLQGGGVKVSTGATVLLGDGEVAVDGLVLELVHVLCLELRLAVVVKDTPVHVGGMMEMHAHSARATENSS